MEGYVQLADTQVPEYNSEIKQMKR